MRDAIDQRTLDLGIRGTLLLQFMAEGSAVIPGYRVCADGSIWTRASGGAERPLRHFPRGAYPAVKVAGRIEFVHRLVAKAHCPNPESKPFVNHIDGNKLNCAAGNLEWCTAAENARHAVDTGLTPSKRGGIAVQQVCPETGGAIATFASALAAAKAVGLSTQSGLARVVDDPSRRAGGFLWRAVEQPHLPDEVWAPIGACDGHDLTDPPYSVSTFGRIRNDRRGQLLAPQVSAVAGGYQVVSLRCNRNRRSFLVHRLVATAFMPGPDRRGLVVNHIDGVRTHNHARNLEWVTQEINAQKAIGASVAQLDPVTRARIGEFPSQSAAARAFNVDHTAIYRAIKFKTRCRGFCWEYAPVVLGCTADAGPVPAPCLSDEDVEGILGSLWT